MHIPLRRQAALAGLLIGCSSQAQAWQQRAPEVPPSTPQPSPSKIDAPEIMETRDSDALFRSVFGTDRPQLLAGDYAVLVDDINVGDYRVTPGAKDGGSIAAGFVRTALLPIASPELAQKLQTLLQKPIVEFSELRAAGLEVAFDPSELVLRIRVPTELRTVRELALRTARRRQDIDYVEQADVSAYLSFRAGVDVIAQTTTSDRGFSGKTADIDFGANVLGLAAQGKLRFDERRRNKWSRGDFRLTYDDVNRLIRYELGDLSVGRRPFQLAPRMAGFSAYREFPIDPYRNVRPISEQGFKLDRPARVEIVLNGVPTRSFDLPAGRFSLRDFPLVPSAANDIELRITYATGEVQVISTMTKPAPPIAREPKCTRWKSPGIPSTHEYMAMGETTMRFFSVQPRSVNGVSMGGTAAPWPPRFTASPVALPPEGAAPPWGGPAAGRAWASHAS